MTRLLWTITLLVLFALMSSAVWFFSQSNPAADNTGERIAGQGKATAPTSTEVLGDIEGEVVFIDGAQYDTDGDGRLSVDEWLAMDPRPDMPEYWTREELAYWKEMVLATSSADPFYYYDDDTIIALAEAGDQRAQGELARIYQRRGDVEALTAELLRRVRLDDPDLAEELYKTGKNWKDRQPELAAAFFGAAEELGFLAQPDLQPLLNDRAAQAGLSRTEMREKGRELLAQLENEQGGGQ